MKNVNRDLIFRIVVSVLTCICFFLLFSGWIKLKDGELRKDAKKTIKNFNSMLKEVDRSDLKYLEAALEEEDISISPKKILDNCENIGGAISDTAIAPSETLTLVPSIIGLFSELTSDDIIDSNIFGGYVNSAFLEDAAEYRGMTYLLIVFVIMFIATLVSAVTVTVFHALNNKKFAGISLAICSFIMFIIYLAAVIAINSWSNKEYYENLVTLSAAPIWMLILSVASMLIWIEKDKIGDALFGKNPSATKASASNSFASSAAPAPAAAPSSAVTFCPNCGTKLDDDSAFCPECGTRI